MVVDQSSFKECMVSLSCFVQGAGLLLSPGIAFFNWKCINAVAAAFTKVMSGHAWFSA
jgi:hypothetical protein